MIQLVRFSDIPSLPRASAAEWTIHHTIPRPGKILVLGDAKQGKTTLALSLALSVAQGLPFLGRPAVAGPVLYFYVDEQPADFQKKITDLMEAGHSMEGHIWYPNPRSPEWPFPFNILTQQTQAKVDELLRAVNPALTIIDVLRNFHSADENDSTAMKHVNDILTHLWKDRSLVLLHHTSKVSDFVADTSKSPVSRSRGSTAIAGNASAVWLVDQGLLTMQPRWDAITKHPMKWGETGLWEFPDLARDTQQAEACRSLCSEFPHGSHNTIAKVAADRWKVSRSAYYRHLAGFPCIHSVVTPPSEVAGSLPVADPGELVAP